jgi:hypothetical protein
MHSLEGQDLSHTALTQIKLFQRTDMARLTCQHTVLRHAVLIGMSAPQASFKESDLSYANLSEAQCDDARFYRARLFDADLRAIRAMGGRFEGADLRYANFEDADLRGARFDDTNLRYASFAGARLTGARFDRADVAHADFTGSTLDPDALLGATTTEGATVPDGCQAAAQATAPGRAKAPSSAKALSPAKWLSPAAATSLVAGLSRVMAGCRRLAAATVRPLMLAAAAGAAIVAWSALPQPTGSSPFDTAAEVIARRAGAADAAEGGNRPGSVGQTRDLATTSGSAASAPAQSSPDAQVEQAAAIAEPAESAVSADQAELDETGETDQAAPIETAPADPDQGTGTTGEQDSGQAEPQPLREATGAQNQTAAAATSAGEDSPGGEDTQTEQGPPTETVAGGLPLPGDGLPAGVAAATSAAPTGTARSGIELIVGSDGGRATATYSSAVARGGPFPVDDEAIPFSLGPTDGLVAIAVVPDSADAVAYCSIAVGSEVLDERRAPAGQAVTCSLDVSSR